jgi:hypothetical protein
LRLSVVVDLPRISLPFLTIVLELLLLLITLELEAFSPALLFEAFREGLLN